MKILVNGCFDCLHAGHRHFLGYLLGVPDYELVIGLNSDASVKALKGEHRPLQTYEVRKANLQALFPYAVILEFEGDALALALFVQPDLIVRGWDQKVEDGLRELADVRVLLRHGTASTSSL